MKTMRYWFQIRLMTNQARGYFVNVGVGIYDDASGRVIMRLAPDAPPEAHSFVTRVTRTVGIALLDELEYMGGRRDGAYESALDALQRILGAHPGSSIQPGPLLGMTTREPIEKLLEDTYREQVE